MVEGLYFILEVGAFVGFFLIVICSFSVAHQDLGVKNSFKKSEKNLKWVCLRGNLLPMGNPLRGLF